MTRPPRHETAISGSVLLSAYPFPKLRVACRWCKRRARYDTAELIRRVGGQMPLPTLRLHLADRLGCTLAWRNLRGAATAGMEQCSMDFPDLVARDG